MFEVHLGHLEHITTIRLEDIAAFAVLRHVLVFTLLEGFEFFGLHRTWAWSDFHKGIQLFLQAQSNQQSQYVVFSFHFKTDRYLCLGLLGLSGTSGNNNFASNR